MSSAHTAPRRSVGKALLVVVATAAGLWLGVAAPDVSPVADPAATTAVLTPAGTDNAPPEATTDDDTRTEPGGDRNRGPGPGRRDGPGGRP